MAANKNPKPLTERQEKFVAFKLAGNSNIEAARLAGYKQPKVSAEANMRRPEVLNALQEKLAAITEECEVTAERLMKEYARIGFAQIGNGISAADKIRALDSMSKTLGTFAPDKVQHSGEVTVVKHLVGIDIEKDLLGKTE